MWLLLYKQNVSLYRVIVEEIITIKIEIFVNIYMLHKYARHSLLHSVNSLTLTLQQSYKIDTFVIPSLLMMKQRHREVTKLVHNL